MKLKDFKKLCEYASINWRGKFTPSEIEEFSKEYYEAYKESGNTHPIIKSLITQLKEDGGEEAQAFLKKLSACNN